jgi:uncharacterized membrane protein
MKNKLIVLATLFAPLAALATPSVTPGASSNVTLTLTATHTETVTDTATSFVTKQVVTRYSNKELLADLLAEGVLSDTVTTGWKLVVVDRTPLLSDDGNTLVFYAIKTGRAPVVIPADRFGIDVNTNVSAEALKHTFSGETLTATSDTFKSIIGVSGHQVLEGSYDQTFDLTAISVGGNASSVRSIKVNTTSFNFTFNLLGAIKLSPIIGTLTDNNSGDMYVIDGSLGFSAFTVLDISSYPAESL